MEPVLAQVDTLHTWREEAASTRGALLSWSLEVHHPLRGQPGAVTNQS